jgi:putative hemolysin
MERNLGVTRNLPPGRYGTSVASDILIALLFLAAGILAFILVVAAEAGVVAGVRERALREPAESRVEALRRFYHERQLTLSSLTLARNLALVGVTAIVVFLVLREWDDSWLVLALTTLAIAAAFLLLQAFPRAIVTQDPTRSQKALRPIVNFIRVTFRLPVLILDAPMGAVLRNWQRRQAAIAGGAEELILLIEMEQASASLHDDERQMIRGVIELEFTNVREVMVPRTDIIAVDVNTRFDDTAALMVERGFSRIPVYEENLDNVVGIVHGKEIMKHMANKERRPTLREIMRPTYFVPESKKVHDLLAEMRQNQISIAIIVDEYGGTAGLVTIEDLLEEIVGEIRDEFDIEDQPVQLLTQDEVIVDARVGIDDLSEMFDVQIKKNDFDSIGGFIINELGRIPSVGDNVRVNGISLKVLSVAGRRIKKVRVTKLPEHEPQPGGNNGVR